MRRRCIPLKRALEYAKPASNSLVVSMAGLALFKDRDRAL